MFLKSILIFVLSVFATSYFGVMTSDMAKTSSGNVDGAAACRTNEFAACAEASQSLPVGGVKFGDLVKPFSGCEGADVTQWLRKFEKVAKLRLVSDLHDVLPLFLEGAAYNLYDELGEEEQDSYELIKKALLKAYAKNPFNAYEEFAAGRLAVGESADDFMARLRQLAKLADVDYDGMLK